MYKILIRPDILSKEAAHQLLDREKNGNKKTLIISRILKCYQCSEEELNRYMKDKNHIVRKKALEMPELGIPENTRKMILFDLKHIRIT